MELALEAAPVGDFQQEVGVGGRLQFVDPRLCLRQLGPEPANRRFGVVGRGGCCRPLGRGAAGLDALAPRPAWVGPRPGDRFGPLVCGRGFGQPIWRFFAIAARLGFTTSVPVDTLSWNAWFSSS